jgi:cell wall-associated NlpC family hydrolase
LAISLPPGRRRCRRDHSVPEADLKPLDPRLHAHRPDLADVALRGRVEAARFVTGKAMRVAAPLAPVRREPADFAPLDTEALRGELVMVFEARPSGWAWIQLVSDGYVGWLPLEALTEPGREPTHKVSALRTFSFSKPDIKSPPLAGLPLGAYATVIGEAEDRNARYFLIEPEGTIVQQHLVPLGHAASDWTAIAERFLGVPYLWGGKSSLGIDCSGLVQVSLGACGIAAPRDSDMQAESVGVALTLANGIPALKRGDFVFWPGHVAIMRDAETLVHATGYRLEVVVEPLAGLVERQLRRNLHVSAIRRCVTD